MIKHIIRFEWKEFFRSSYWQKSIALNVLMIFMALFLILTFLGIGFGLYPILQKEFPDSDPLKLVNGFLFYWFLTDLFVRFFLQKLPVIHVKPLLILPLKKGKIVHYVLVKSMTSFFNFLPFFAIIPFAGFLLNNAYDYSLVLTWVACLLLFTLIINFFNFIIEAKSAETELSFVPIMLFGSGLFALNYFEIISFSKQLLNAISSIIEQPIFLLIPATFLILLYSTNYSILKKKLVIDGSFKERTQTATSRDFTWTRRFGSIAPFLQLDLKLLWRNKRPRSSIFILLLGLLYGLVFYPNPVYQDMMPMFVFVGIFVTGIFMINFGQFIPAWDSGYYKLLMSQNVKYFDYLNAKFSWMAMSAVIMFVLSIPYTYFGWKILIIHFAAMVYNIGVNGYVLLFAGSFNKKSIDLTQRAVFNYQGTGAVQWLVGVPLMLLPILFFYIPYKFIGFEAGIFTLIILGGIGIVLHQKLMRIITKRYVKTKHRMIQDFEQKG
jgi:hypothetical protein